MEKSKNKRKNYIILAVIYIAVIILVLYLASWYQTYQDYQREIPVLRNVVNEVTTEELDHYLLENPDTILYFSNATDEETRDFEADLKESIEDNTWQEMIAYVNVANEKDIDSYFGDFLTKYGNQDFTMDRLPVIVKITGGKIEALNDGLNGAMLTTNDVAQFIDIYDQEQ